MRYKEKYIKRTLNILFEAIDVVFNESKQTEQQGLSILKKANIANPENIIKSFAKDDKSKNQKNIPLMAFFYANGEKNIELIITTVNEYEDLLKDKKIDQYQLSKKGLKIGGKTYEGFVKFSELVHGIQSKLITQQKYSISDSFEAEEKPLFSGDGIDVYDGTDVKKCIKYGHGGLTGRAYSFCIGALGSANMFSGYRGTQDSTFYYIVDRNKFKKDKEGNVDLTDPLHMVVFDRTNNGISLTDANNTTGTIASPFGQDTEKYVQYLKKHKVPVEKLVNKPKTEKEIELDKLIRYTNSDLDFFKKLSYENKLEYVSRGHRLTYDQFKSLEGDDFIISRYVDTGLEVGSDIVKDLTRKQLKTYIRKRIISVERESKCSRLKKYEVDVLKPNELDAYLDSLLNKKCMLYSNEIKELSKEKKEKYIKYLYEKVDSNEQLFEYEFLQLPPTLQKRYLSKKNSYQLISLSSEVVKKLRIEVRKIYIDLVLDDYSNIRNLNFGVFSNATYDQKKKYIDGLDYKQVPWILDERSENIIRAMPEPIQNIFIDKVIKEVELGDNSKSPIDDNIVKFIKSVNTRNKLIDSLVKNRRFVDSNLFKYLNDDQKPIILKSYAERGKRLDKNTLKYIAKKEKESYIESLIDKKITLDEFELEAATEKQKERYIQRLIDKTEKENKNYISTFKPFMLEAATEEQLNRMLTLIIEKNRYLWPHEYDLASDDVKSKYIDIHIQDGTPFRNKELWDIATKEQLNKYLDKIIVYNNLRFSVPDDDKHIKRLSPKQEIKLGNNLAKQLSEQGEDYYKLLNPERLDMITKRIPTRSLVIVLKALKEKEQYMNDDVKKYLTSLIKKIK